MSAPITVRFRRLQPESRELLAAVARFKASLGTKGGPQRRQPRIMTFFGVIGGRAVAVRYESTLNRPGRVYRRETTIVLEADELATAQRLLTSKVDGAS